MKKYLFTAILTASALYCSAESPFREYIRQAVDNSTSIKAGEARIDAEKASTLADNTPEGPEIEFEHLWASASSDKKWNIGVTQELSFPGLYRARSQAADRQAQASATVLFGVKADKALAAKLAILDIINARARRGLYSTINSNLSRIADLTERQFESGNATILSLRKMQLAVIDNESAIAGIDADIDALLAILEGMAVTAPGRDDAVWAEYPLQAFDRSGNATDAYLNSLAEATEAANRATAKAVRLEAWPSIAIGYRHAFEESRHFNGLSVSLRLPSFSQSKRRKAAELQAMAATLDNTSQRLEVKAEENGLQEAASQLSETIARYRSLLGDDSYLQLLGKAYDGGELNVIEYLQEINLYTESRLNYLDMVYRYNLTLARLNRYKSMDF